MAVPYVDDDHQPNKRWGTELPFNALGSVIEDPEQLREHNERVQEAGREAAARLRSSADK